VHRLIVILLGAGIIAGNGCSSSPTTDDRWAPSDTISSTKTTTFETRTDTVAPVHAQPTPDLSPYSTAPVQYTVQIGAFREARNANATQTLARERFQVPVVNEYSAVRRLYQIRVGFFPTKDLALDFVKKLRATYPHEYKDAWIVRLNK
jgi:cell division septation protein DedD